MFTSKLLLFLVLASCTLFAIGRSIPRVAIELDRDGSSGEGFQNDGEATSPWQNDGQTYLERQVDLLTARGILDVVKNKVDQAEKKAEEFKDKAKDKVNEAKNKAGSVMNNLPGSLGKRQFIDLKNFREDNIESFVESGDGMLENLEDVNQEANINDAREGTSDAITMNNEDDFSADDTYSVQGNMYIADTVEGEAAVNDQQDYGLYEDEDQNNYLEDEDAKDLNDELSGRGIF